MSTAKNANAPRQRGEDGKTLDTQPDSSTRKTIHVGLLVEWLVILAACIGILLLSGIAR